MKYLITIGIFLASISGTYANNYCKDNLDQIERFMQGKLPFSPIVDYGCLDSSPAYVRGALTIFSLELEEQLLRLENLENKAIDLRAELLNRINEVEKEIIKDLGNESFNKEKAFLKIANIEQELVFNSRNFMNEVGNMRGMGALLENFLPHIEGDSKLIQQKLGYESSDEVQHLQEYLFEYGQDLRDAPIEVEAAVNQLMGVGERLKKIWETYLK